MNKISFMSANYVARVLGYNMTEGWGQGDNATNEYFRPIETFRQRFEEILADIRALGFDHMDLWLAHLNPRWATDEHVRIARELLGKHGLGVVSLAGGMGSSREELERICSLAQSLGVTILGGVCPLLYEDRNFVVDTLKRYNLKLGIENHPERTPQEMLEKIGDGGDGTIGTTVDTGWYGTQGYDAAKAIEELAPYVLHVHLKDVREVGSHHTCRYGEGVVPIKECVEVLKQIGYEGAISVEHEPETFDPSEDCRADLQMLREWLS